MAPRSAVPLGYLPHGELTCAPMSDFDPPPHDASPGSAPNPFDGFGPISVHPDSDDPIEGAANVEAQLDDGEEMSLPSAMSASDPDRTPVNPFLVPGVEASLVTSVREMTPVTVPRHEMPAPYRGPMETMPGLFAPTPRRTPPLPPSAAHAVAGFAEPPAAVEMESVPSSVVTSARAVPAAPRPAPPAAPVFEAAPISQPRVVAQAPAQAAPLISRADVEIPTYKDPHAAFRKGTKLKGFMLAALAASAIAGLIYLTPQPPAVEAKTPELRDLRANAVIGASVSPDIIPDPKNVPLEQRSKPERAAESGSSAAPSHADNSGFAHSFKSQAK